MIYFTIQNFIDVLTLYHKAFSPFPTMFSILPKTNFNFSATFNLSSANTLNLDQSKNLSFGKELKKEEKDYCFDTDNVGFIFKLS